MHRNARDGKIGLIKIARDEVVGCLLVSLKFQPPRPIRGRRPLLLGLINLVPAVPRVQRMIGLPD